MNNKSLIYVCKFKKHKRISFIGNRYSSNIMVKVLSNLSSVRYYHQHHYKKNELDDGCNFNRMIHSLKNGMESWIIIKWEILIND